VNASVLLLEASGDFKEELRVNFMGGEPLLRFDLIRKIVHPGLAGGRGRAAPGGLPGVEPGGKPWAGESSSTSGPTAEARSG
jgi:hypothetical protein